MAEPGDILHSDGERPSPKTPWGLIIGVILAIALGVLLFWMTREKKNEQAREAVIAILDKELGTEQDAIKSQREKVLELSRRVETLRAMIQAGEKKNTKAAVAEFNQLAAAQRAERDKFAQMAEHYNKKVAKFHELQQ